MATIFDQACLLGFPLEIIHELGGLTASLIRKLTGRPSDAELIVQALSEGVERFASVADKFADAALMRAQADLMRVYVDMTNARARLIEAEAALWSATSSSGRAKARCDRESARADLIHLLCSLDNYMLNFDVLVEQPLIQAPDQLPH